MSSLPPTLAHALVERASDAGDAPAFRTLVSGGARAERVWTWQAFCTDAHRLAAGLLAQGIGRGDRIAILAGNTPVWPLADQAALRLGAVSVGLYPSSAPQQVEDVIRDSGARVVFVDSSEQMEKVLAVLPQLRGLELIVRSDESDAAEQDPGVASARVTSLSALGEGDLSALAGVPFPGPDDDAILIYTSGSTGEPKGARITHRTLVASTDSIREALGLRSSDRALSYLPFCHAAERVTGQATRILLGMEAGLVEDATRLFEAAADFRPTFLGGLPRFYEKIWEAELAERGPDASAPSPVIDRLTGGAVRIATSGGAALPMEVARGLDRLGLTVLGAYGLTEHLCCCFSRPDDVRFDDVGPPMPRTEIRIAEDGEILVRRNELTFAGYHGRPDATREAFTDDGEWLRTGDLGELSEGVRLTVTGRKKELIALSTGKKIAPIRIEARLVDQPWISQAVLVGEGRKYIAALVTLRRPVVEAWAGSEGLDLAWPDLARDPAVHAGVERQIEAVNATVSRTESVRRFSVLESPFTIEDGELTSTHKPRRDAIANRRAAAIDALYAGGLA